MAPPARERRPPATTTAGTAWSPHRENWAGLRPAQPAGGGRREGPPFRGSSFSSGIPAFGVIRTWEWQNRSQRCGLRRHPIKADGKEPPAALRAAVPAPTRRNVHDRVLRTPRRARKWRGTHVGLTTRHPPWFRAPARCRPEADVPSRPCHCAISYTRSHAHPSPRCGESGPSCDGEYEKFGLTLRLQTPEMRHRQRRGVAAAETVIDVDHGNPRGATVEQGEQRGEAAPRGAVSR